MLCRSLSKDCNETLWWILIQVSQKYLAKKYVYCDSVITVCAKIRNLARLVPPPELATGRLNLFQRKLNTEIKRFIITQMYKICEWLFYLSKNYFLMLPNLWANSPFELWIASFPCLHYLQKGEHNLHPRLCYVWYLTINCSNIVHAISK